MSDSQFKRLRWAYPKASPRRGGVATLRADIRAGAIDLLTAEVSRAQPDGRALMEQALNQVGLPVGSTEEARSSPLLEARDLLRAAAEIEHGLLVQYLYAAYSCRDTVTGRKLAKIAKEEMGHLICVQNLLLAIGGNPYFGREHFPTSPGSDEVFPFALAFEPISLDSLAKYVVAESPPLESITDPELRKRVEPIIAVGKGAAQQAINHVGALYVALYWLFKEDDSAPAAWPDYPTDWVRPAHEDQKPPRTNWHIRAQDFAKQDDINDLQAIESEGWNRGDESVFVRAVEFLAGGAPDRGPILKTLFDIADQGEGWQQPTTPSIPTDEPKEPSHFQRFLETYEAVKAMPAGGLPLAINVPTNPSTVEPTAVGFIANPEANLWGQIFNLRYRILMLKLALTIASRRSLDSGALDGRAALIDLSLAEMKNNIRTIAKELITMRRKGVAADGPEPMKAAPPFEFPAGSLPNLVGLDPDPKIAQAKATKLLRRTLKAAFQDMSDLVNRVNALPTDLLDAPSARQVLNDIVTNDAQLLAVLGD